MKVWAVVEAGVPLEEIELPTPQPTGSEVVVEVTHCGVCHSDLHFWKGQYNMGGGKVMNLAERGVTLPRAPGHEIAGKVVALGPDAVDVAVGDVRVVYPWLGCGHCKPCLAGQDNMCLAQHSIGVIHHGGFGSHVVVPHSRYLVDPGNVDPGVAATYACSGITTYSAIQKILPVAPDAPIVVIGAGGVGLAAVAMLQALGHKRILSVDTAADKREAAAAAGAEPIDGNGDDLAQRLVAAAGDPIVGVLDCVNNSATSRAGFDALGKGGTLVPVGVAGGELTLSLAALIFRANAVRASNTGTLQDLRDVIALANAGKLKPTPVVERPINEANEALQDLKHGRVTGRQILVHNCADH